MTSPTTAIKRSTSPSASLVASTNDLSSQQQQQQLPAQPPQQHGRASRPPPRSTFDLEPNPFEHSFSSTSAVSKDTPQQENSASTTSSGGNQSYISNPNGPNANGAPIDGDQSQNGVAAKDGEESKPMLPPLAALESPAGSAFGSWGLASSLRSGPLSPAMLAGPASQQTPSLGLAAFDSSFVRTGLTPDVGRTGLTPLLGGPGGYPPPSPNTAALFALVNGTSAGNGLANVPITPGTLSAIAGALNQPMGSLHQPGTMSLDPQNQSLLDSNQPQTMAPAQSQFGGHQPDAYTSHDSASHAITNAASALFLLSQQQSMQRHQNQAQQQQQVDPSAVSGNQQSLHQNPTSPITRRATKRKSTDVPLAAPPRGKKTKSNASVNTRGASRKKSAKADDMDEDGDDDEDEDDDEEYMEGFMQAPSTTTGARSGATKGMKKAETEEEKRKNFLERNRQAALKCRQRKKAWLTALQAKVEFLQNENERLGAALYTSREEIARLSQALVARGGQPSSLLNDPELFALSEGINANGSMNATVERARSDSSASTSTAQAVHVKVPLPGGANGLNGNSQPVGPPPGGMTTGMGHSHSQSHSVVSTNNAVNGQGQVMGHARAHSHGHIIPPSQNGVTVGGRGYGY